MFNKRQIQDEFNALMENYPQNYDLILKKSQELDKILYQEMLQMQKNKLLFDKMNKKKDY